PPQTIEQSPADSTESESEEPTASDGELIDQENTNTPAALDTQTLAREAIELMIAKYTAAAIEDALAAGLDPGMDINQTLLNQVIADQVLQQLPVLAEALAQSVDGDAQAIADGLPDASWPANDIALAMQSFAGDAPMEADPIAALEEQLFALMKDCEGAATCPIKRSSFQLDDEMNLSIVETLVFLDGSEEDVPSPSYEVSNLVLHSDGEWRNFDTSGMAQVTRTGEYRAQIRDGNDSLFSLRATTRNATSTPVQPILDKQGLTPADTPDAQPEFAEKSQLVTLSQELSSDRYELVFAPSDDALQRAATAQALEQSQITLERLENSFDVALETASEAEFTSEQSSQDAEAAKEEVEALNTAIDAIEMALEDARTALVEATAEAEAIAESSELVAAYESVLEDSELQLTQIKSDEQEAAAALGDAQNAQLVAVQTLADAQDALDTLLGIDVEAGVDETDTETQVTNPDSENTEEEQPNTEIAAAEAAVLQAERDLIIADADLANAEQAATDAADALAQAEAEHDAAAAALTEAKANQLNNAQAETELQSAELLVSANEANLQLIEQQLVNAETVAGEAAVLAEFDAQALEEAQSTLDQLALQVTSATDALAAAQAAASLAPMPQENGCDGTLPAQSTDNYNCSVIERRIGDAPTSTVATLQELTATQSTLTLLQLHPSYAVSMIPANGAAEGEAVWHAIDTSYDPQDTALPRSQWQAEQVNGVDLIRVQVPAALHEPGNATELFMVEQDNYVRPGVVIHAGEQKTQLLFNRQALGSIFP
ncbi:MAG: hypothetical protein ACPGSC_07925, partial [Granulosicoccaceae bacterium]